MHLAASGHLYYIGFSLFVILQVFDPMNPRYEVPIDTPKVTPFRPNMPKYKVMVSKEVFGVKITRGDAGGSTL